MLILCSSDYKSVSLTFVAWFVYELEKRRINTWWWIRKWFLLESAWIKHAKSAKPSSVPVRLCICSLFWRKYTFFCIISCRKISINLQTFIRTWLHLKTQIEFNCLKQPQNQHVNQFPEYYSSLEHLFLSSSIILFFAAIKWPNFFSKIMLIYNKSATTFSKSFVGLFKSWFNYYMINAHPLVNVLKNWY